MRTQSGLLPAASTCAAEWSGSVSLAGSIRVSGENQEAIKGAAVLE